MLKSNIPTSSVSMSRVKLIRTRNRLSLIKFYSSFLSNNSVIIYENESINKHGEIEYFHIINKSGTVTINDYNLFNSIIVMNSKIFTTKNEDSLEGSEKVMKVQFLI